MVLVYPHESFLLKEQSLVLKRNHVGPPLVYKINESFLLHPQKLGGPTVLVFPHRFLVEKILCATLKKWKPIIILPTSRDEVPQKFCDQQHYHWLMQSVARLYIYYCQPPVTNIKNAPPF